MADADPFPAKPAGAPAVTSPAVASSAAPPVTAADPEPGRSKWRWPVMLGVPLLVVAGALYWWFGNPGVVKTDNAYVKLDIISVAPEVAGKLIAVHVREGQQVKAGDVLFTVDPAPYQVAISQAEAQIAAAQANVTSLQAEVGASAADIAGARDDLALAEANYARGQALMERGFNTRADMDRARHAVASARDKLAAIEAEVVSKRAKLATGSAVPGVNPAIAAASAARARAQLDLRRTVLRAPADGTITQANRLQVGQMVFPGVGAVSLVVANSARIDANFKETDLAHMQVGQPVDIALDAYPDHALKGHVMAIGAGTGSEFSVLPAQNATGNWIKITQRVPVRIAIDGQLDSRQPGQRLIAGLSAVVKVHVGKP